MATVIDAVEPAVLWVMLEGDFPIEPSRVLAVGVRCPSRPPPSAPRCYHFHSSFHYRRIPQRSLLALFFLLPLYLDYNIIFCKLWGIILSHLYLSHSQMQTFI
jgi:hypothetical protein